MTDGCGAPAQSAGGTVDYAGQAVVEGTVMNAVTGRGPVTTGYARLLDGGGDFVAEVPLGDDGSFRFFAAPGGWTVRVLAPGGVRVDTPVSTDYGRPARLTVTV